MHFAGARVICDKRIFRNHGEISWMSRGCCRDGALPGFVLLSRMAEGRACVGTASSRYSSAILSLAIPFLKEINLCLSPARSQFYYSRPGWSPSGVITAKIPATRRAASAGFGFVARKLYTLACSRVHLFDSTVEPFAGMHPSSRGYNAVDGDDERRSLCPRRVSDSVCCTERKDADTAACVRACIPRDLVREARLNMPAKRRR